MNLLMDLRVLSVLAAILSVSQLAPLLVAITQGETIRPFISSMSVGLACASLFLVTGRAKPELRARDGILIVAAGWAMATVLGGLPFVYGGWMGWIDSWFETASGFTTTGASIVPDVEIWPKSQLFWRATIQWLGGMGILLLTIAILPFLGVAGMEVMKAEVPGPTKDRLVPRIATTARIFWGLYIGITVANIIVFMLCDMDFLEATDHTFATLATGGFSTRNASFAAFSPAAQWWCTFFMAVAGANFVIHYRLLIKRDLTAFLDSELVTYIGIMVFSSLLIGGVLAVISDRDLETAMRHSFFNVASIMTTTGFANDDFAKWPMFTQVILLCLMVIGGMAGSTAGGIKVVRLVMWWKLFVAVIHRLLQPRQVIVVKYEGTVLTHEIIEGSMVMIVLFLFLTLFSVVILAGVGWNDGTEMDFTSAFSGVLACIANVGPGLAKLGPIDNYSNVHDIGKLLLTFLMLAGRLELFTLVILFFPRYWKD